MYCEKCGRYSKIYRLCKICDSKERYDKLIAQIKAEEARGEIEVEWDGFGGWRITKINKKDNIEKKEDGTETDVTL